MFLDLRLRSTEGGAGKDRLPPVHFHVADVRARAKSPTLKKEHREFHIPKLERERSLYGSEFEIQLRNELTQRAIAKECADWMRQKAIFRSNRGAGPDAAVRRASRSGQQTSRLSSPARVHRR